MTDSKRHTVYAYCSADLDNKIAGAVEGAGSHVFSGAGRRFTEVTAHLSRKTEDLVIVEYTDRNAADAAKLADYLRGRGVRFIVVCDQVKNGFAGLNAGAVNMLVMPPNAAEHRDKFFVSSLSYMIKDADLRKDGDARILKKEFEEIKRRVVAIGASTGGSDAVAKILREMPADAPPVVAVMHMPPVFTKIYAEGLNSTCKISVWEANDGDRLKTGLAIIAKGDRHLLLNKDANGYYVSLDDRESIGGHRPSIDLFFDSVAKCAGRDAVGVILTGMGADGAKGITNMRHNGAFTIGQDQATSIVYGMPRAAWEMGGIARQAPLGDIAGHILKSSVL